jgi:hypothetical protein
MNGNTVQLTNSLAWPDPQLLRNNDGSQCVFGLPFFAFHLWPMAYLPFDAAVIASGSAWTHPLIQELQQHAFVEGGQVPRGGETQSAPFCDG